MSMIADPTPLSDHAVTGRRRGPRSALPRAQAAEGALETTTVRLRRRLASASAPQYVAEELLRAEGFTDIRYVDASAIGAIAPVAHGEVDFAPIYAVAIRQSDRRRRADHAVGGRDVGCFELFAREGIRSIAELKGKSVGVQAAGSLSQQLRDPDGGPGRARSRQGHPLGHRPRGQADRAVRRGKDRRVSRLSA